LITDSPVSCNIDLDAPGKQIGRLTLPRISNTGGWAYSLVPIATVARGKGPTVLVLAGNHGDEYEGQIAALRLLQELQPEQVTGRVIICPRLSVEASRANTRLWPGSNANFNRSFPGRPNGPPNEQLADFLTRGLFPRADVVIDMHSGGRSAWFLPCSHMHVVDDPAQRQVMLDAMLAWNSDFHFLYIDVNGNGLLPVEAENQGKLVITTELGGGGRTPGPVHALAWTGLNNVLRHVGVMTGPVQTRASLGLPEPIILDGRNPATIIGSEEAGTWEGIVEPGQPVQKGQLVGRLWFQEDPKRPPTRFEAPMDGYMVVQKAIHLTEAGDMVYVLGVPITPGEILRS